MENHLADDPARLAWAAGIFEGEGSATFHLNRGRGRAELFVYQAGKEEPPALLTRFHDVVGCGSVVGPYRARLWCWRAAHPRAIAKVVTMLWPWLGGIKRTQVLAMSDAAPALWFLRDVAELWDIQPRPRSVSRTDECTLAWAAGIFGGEGSIWLSRSGRYRQLQASITQASENGIPDVLQRFRSAVLDIGTITGPYTPTNTWSRLPQYRWQSGSYEGVQTVVALLWSWLDPRKRAQARAALVAHGASAPEHVSTPRETGRKSGPARSATARLSR